MSYRLVFPSVISLLYGFSVTLLRIVLYCKSMDLMVEETMLTTLDREAVFFFFFNFCDIGFSSIILFCSTHQQGIEGNNDSVVDK